MAGRVERIFNDKLYFVLDEVGASDCESERGSESETKLVNLSIEKDQILNNEEKEKSINNIKEDEKKKKLISEEFIDPKIKDECVSEDKKVLITEKSHSGTSVVGSPDNETIQCSENNSGDSLSEEMCTAIDMDTGSDEDFEESYNFNDNPLISLTFRDSTTEKLLKPSLLKFISQKIGNCRIVTNVETGNIKVDVYDNNPKHFVNDDLIGFEVDKTPDHNNYTEIPRYGKNPDFILSEKGSDKESEKLSASVTIACFNCLKNHNLRDCPLPKDFKVINKNRLLFQKQNKVTSKSKVSRYHLDENQKFSHIIPGVISKKLRNALNLHRDQQPSFIYKMRQLGYPPAWLEEAKVSHSGVAMYDSTGVPVLEEDEEEGEIIPEGSKDKFDISKIIEFPGFNVPLPHNFKEEAKFYGCPEISEKQSKENLIKLLEPKTVQAYIKKSLGPTKSEEKSEKSPTSTRTSPTIKEMEEKKRQLLMELDDEDSTSAFKVNSDDSLSYAGTETSQNNLMREPGKVKNLEFGTPILKSVSPFSKLPSREQFSINVSEIINFENLPNSTGKYETMRHVITKIRISTSKAKNE